MPTPILMPALSPTMESGKLAKWLKKEGDEVRSGDVIAEIETDKATMEVEAADEGIIGRLLVAEGSEGVAVNTPIAVLLQNGEDAGAPRRNGNGAAARAPEKGAAPQAEPAHAAMEYEAREGPGPAATVKAEKVAPPAAHERPAAEAEYG